MKGRIYDDGDNLIDTLELNVHENWEALEDQLPEGWTIEFDDEEEEDES